MSADVWLEGIDDDRKVVRCSTSACSGHLNVTYNLTPMMRATGVWEGWSDEVTKEGLRATDLGDRLNGVLEALLSDPDKYRALNPENGWGDYDGLVLSLREFIEGCRRYPTATVGSWL